MSKLKAQFDSKVRVVSVENLRAMCKRMSSIAHTYEVTQVSKSRVHVTYSNPSEYGTPNPMTAVFPCYPLDVRDKESDNHAVVLEYLRIINDHEGGEGWQDFEELRDCPQLWRAPQDGKWYTEAEAKAKFDAQPFSAE